MTTTTHTAKSTSRPLGVSTLALAAAVVIEIAGLRALDPASAGVSYVASADGAPVAVATAVAPRKFASVEVRVIAQADQPAR